MKSLKSYKNAARAQHAAEERVSGVNSITLIHTHTHTSSIFTEMCTGTDLYAYSNVMQYSGYFRLFRPG